MNGATEATLAELLRVAQEQNANMERLTELMNGRSRSGGGGGGGLADMARNIPLVSTAFAVAGAAVSAVSSVFEMLGNVVGKMVDGVGSAIKGLWSFSQKAMEGTARMSDLFDAFGKLPFFIGELFQVGAGLLRILEKLTDEYIMMSKVGAGFTGGLTEMRDVAQNLGIAFVDLTAMTSKNSQELAAAGLTVSGGFRKFVNGMDVLMGPDSQFRNSMFALGVSSKEAGEYMMTMMKLNQSQIRTGKMDAESLGRQTKDYIEKLDDLTRLTGIHRDQVNEIIKKQADDATMENFLATLSPDKAADIRQLMALSTVKMGKEYTENVLRPQILGMAQGITGPVNAVGAEIAVATNGASVTMFENIKRVLESNVKDKGKMMFEALGGIALSAKQQADLLLKSGLSAADVLKIENTMLQFGTAYATGAATAYASSEKERKAAQARADAQVELMTMQENMIRFGNSLTMFLASIAKTWGPTLITIGNFIMVELLSGLAKFLTWIKSPEVQQAWNTIVEFFNDVILPKLKAIGAWFGETWDQLVKAWTKDGISGVMVVMRDRIEDGIKNIWAQIQKIWEIVSPGLIKIWDNDIKPVIVKLWNDLFNAMMNTIKNYLFGEKTSGTEGGAARQQQYNDVDKRNQSSFTWYEKANQQILNLNDALFSLWDKDLGERVRNARIARQTEIINERNKTPGFGGIGSRAGGGMVNPGTYLVGEKGPELLSVGASGNVITNENLQKLLNKLAGESDNNYIASALEELNNTMKRIENYSASTTDNTRRAVGAIAQISGDIMPTI